MNIDMVRAAIGPESPGKVIGSGIYVWFDAATVEHPVLYIGKSGNVARRTSNERTWTEQFKDARRRGNTLWYSAGCGLSAVLAAAADPQVFMWAFGKPEAAATERALIRLAAMTGGTPPAQGGGWGWGRGDQAGSPDAVHQLLNLWFQEDHMVHRIAEAGT
ncbi:hypothetical protein ACGF0D_36005 [Kitasatospora sp. NPDC048298]|uniref:hypothetical protein n=1 Tax=Kitasatospora sp. NPDC048298 TaxID=3364049 RepID=UPI003723ECCA